MIEVLPPWKVQPPMAMPGMRVSVAPSPHTRFLDDYEYYDALGRDPLQQNDIWSITDPTEQVDKLKELLDEYPKQKHRRQILFKAAVRGNESIVRCLVETGLKVHPDIPSGKTEESKGDDDEDKESEHEESIPDRDDPTAAPLHTAANRGHLGCVKILLEEGHVEVDILDEFTRTPLIAAAGSADTETVRYLLGQGADPTARLDAENELTREYFTEFAGANALEIAAANGNIEAVKLLLEHPLYGSMRKRKSKEGKEQGIWVTPLAIKAAAGKDFGILKLLLERGAYPLEDKDGKTKAEQLSNEERQAIIDATPPAAEHGDLESLKLLLSYQYPTDNEGNVLPFEVPETLHRPFIYGAYHAMIVDKPEKFEFISSFGLKEHDTMSLDKLPEGQLLNIQHLLDKAVTNGSINCAKLMIEKYGADPNRHRSPSGVQPLFAAAGNNRPEMVRYLLENHKPDIHIGSGRFATGPTALSIAIHLKSLESVALLLQHGGPVDHIDEEIQNVTKPMTAILRTEFGERMPVRFETKDNAEAYIKSARSNWQYLNSRYVRLEIGPDDKDWINSLQYRKSDDELREKGPAARELNKKEALKMKDLDETDPRRVMVEYPTFEEREAELDSDDDLIPKWRPAFVPVGQDDSD